MILSEPSGETKVFSDDDVAWHALYCRDHRFGHHIKFIAFFEQLDADKITNFLPRPFEKIFFQ